MNTFLTILLLITCYIAITGFSIMFEWSPLTYFMASVAVGAMAGYVSGKAGYEA